MLGYAGKKDWFGNEQFHLNLLSAFDALENLDPSYLSSVYLGKLASPPMLCTPTHSVASRGAS